MGVKTLWPSLNSDTKPRTTMEMATTDALSASAKSQSTDRKDVEIASAVLLQLSTEFESPALPNREEMLHIVAKAPTQGKDKATEPATAGTCMANTMGPTATILPSATATTVLPRTDMHAKPVTEGTGNATEATANRAHEPPSVPAPPNATGSHVTAPSMDTTEATTLAHDMKETSVLLMDELAINFKSPVTDHLNAFYEKSKTTKVLWTKPVDPAYQVLAEEALDEALIPKLKVGGIIKFRGEYDKSPVMYKIIDFSRNVIQIGDQVGDILTIASMKSANSFFYSYNQVKWLQIHHPLQITVKRNPELTAQLLTKAKHRRAHEDIAVRR